MPIRLNNITDDAHQLHAVRIDEAEVTVTLRYFDNVGMWTISAEYGERSAYGYKLALDTLHMQSRNFPFDFVVLDTSGSGLDPSRKDDFLTGRCELFMLNSSDMEDVRGGPVPL